MFYPSLFLASLSAFAFGAMIEPQTTAEKAIMFFLFISFLTNIVVAGCIYDDSTKGRK